MPKPHCAPRNSTQDFWIFKEPRAYCQSSKSHPARPNRFLCKTGRPPTAASSAGSLKDADNHSRDQVLVRRARPGIINSGFGSRRGVAPLLTPLSSLFQSSRPASLRELLLLTPLLPNLQLPPLFGFNPACWRSSSQLGGGPPEGAGRGGGGADWPNLKSPTSAPGL